MRTCSGLVPQSSADLRMNLSNRKLLLCTLCSVLSAQLHARENFVGVGFLTSASMALKSRCALSPDLRYLAPP